MIPLFSHNRDFLLKVYGKQLVQWWSSAEGNDFLFHHISRFFWLATCRPPYSGCISFRFPHLVNNLQSSLKCYRFNLHKSRTAVSSYSTGFNLEILPVVTIFFTMWSWKGLWISLCDLGGDVREVMGEVQQISRPWESLQDCCPKQNGKPWKGFK